jgi:HSP20 family molecular chaperone IbpA
LLSEIDREGQRQAALEAQREAQLETQRRALLEAQRKAHLEANLKAQLEAHIESQREAHRLRLQRERALRAQFAVNQIEQGWQVDGDIRGFNQENINIEVTDENTLKISGNTKWQAESSHPVQQHADVETIPAVEEQSDEPTSENKMDVEAIHEPDFETVTKEDTTATNAATQDSDMESHKSYQPTVEDDFEDLGAETSSLISTPSRSSSPTEIKEPKGKERAVEEPTTTQSAVASQTQPEAPTQPQQEERVHGSFERTLRFPARIDVANVSASFKDGALRIIVPRAQVQPVRRIAVL